MSSPGVSPAFSIASTSSSSASSFEPRSGAKPPSSPMAVDRPRSWQHRLQHVVGLDAPAQRLAEAGRADRHDHELLEVHVVVGVGAAVEHVQHRHGQHVGVGAADVAVQRQAQLVGRRLGHGQRHAEDGVGAEAGLVVGAVEVEHLAVDLALVEGVEAEQRLADLAVDVVDGAARRPCRRSGRRRRAARPPRTGRSTRPRARWRAPRRPRRGRPRPRPSGCPGSRGPHGRRCARCWTSLVLLLLRVLVTLLAVVAGTRVIPPIRAVPPSPGHGSGRGRARPPAAARSRRPRRSGAPRRPPRAAGGRPR